MKTRTPKPRTGRRWLAASPRFALFLPTLACLSMAACTVGPDYKRPDEPTQTDWYNNAGAKNGTGKADAAHLAQWWKQLGDPTLDKLIETALSNSPTIQTAQARLRESRARRNLQSVQDAPNVSGGLSASRNGTRTDTTNTSSHNFSASLDASWEIDIFGGQRRALEAADASLAATAADLNATRVSLAAEVATDYIALRTDQVRLAVARANLISRDQTTQLTEWRNQAQLVSGLEVNQARSNAEQTRSTVPALVRAIEDDKLTLALLLGLSRTEVEALLPEGSLPMPPATIAVGIPADTLRQRPDVMAAERRLAAQTAQIGVAEAARYPSLKLSGSIGAEALSLGGLLSGDILTNSLVAGLAAPIFDAGRITQNIEIQSAVQEQTLIAYRQTVNQALNDVEKALNAWVRSSERLQVLQGAVDAAREAARLATIRFQAGQTDLLTQLDTQRTQLTQEELLAGAQGDRANTLIQLYKALGGGWQANAANTNSAQ
ncbi:efflux transporter outer membrane subunit [Uliginosibacterium sp. H3]|uniref:Efflux transporter outer membrane subunit n=1 Tax=Uliginosibacterium silvisoli TaxID=3114758 RepID=A0ABU6K968_9RHOO|nr:efflux transporter outer membrane subunit [Uliginosibacterium sp. H3]